MRWSETYALMGDVLDDLLVKIPTEFVDRRKPVDHSEPDPRQHELPISMAERASNDEIAKSLKGYWSNRQRETASRAANARGRENAKASNQPAPESLGAAIDRGAISRPLKRPLVRWIGSWRQGPPVTLNVRHRKTQRLPGIKAFLFESVRRILRSEKVNLKQPQKAPRIAS